MLNAGGGGGVLCGVAVNETAAVLFKPSVAVTTTVIGFIPLIGVPASGDCVKNDVIVTIIRGGSRFGIVR